MEGESGSSRSIIDEISAADIQRDQMEGDGGVSRSIIDELHSSDMAKWKVKVVLFELLWMNFFFRYPRRSNGR